MLSSDYRTMVLLGLGCLAALVAGLALGVRLVHRTPTLWEKRPVVAFRWNELVGSYLAAIFLVGVLEAFAWRIPRLTQAILVLGYSHWALLLLILRRLVHPRIQWQWLGPILLGELVLGFTGFFAGFREPLFISFLVFMERFKWRRIGHWIALSILAALILVTGLLWTAIKRDYRRDFRDEAFAGSTSAHLERVQELSEGWLLQSMDQKTADLDSMVDRMWAVYYPALAVRRVPAVIPHTQGALLWEAVRHILTPRLLFPDKPEKTSDSDKVRLYSGVWVAGREKGVSIAFGYAAESYVDFGVPLMFLPIFLYGLLMGIAYQWLLRAIYHRELAVALVTVVFWLSLYLFERSWLVMLGLSGTLLIYLGGGFILLDRVLLRRTVSLPLRPARLKPRSGESVA
jgi:hypothetical protein